MISYLAAPYSDSNPAVVALRIQRLLEIDGKLMSQGVKTVSPLYKHFMLSHFSGGSTWEYWQEYSEELLNRADNMYVIMLPGWTTSVGVQAEIFVATQLRLPTIYLDENGNVEYEISKQDHDDEYETQCVIAAGR